MPEPLKNKLRCSICNKLIESCKCVDGDGDKYEPDLEEDLFIGYDVKLAVEWLKEELLKPDYSGENVKTKMSKQIRSAFKVHRKVCLELIDKAFPDLNTDK